MADARNLIISAPTSNAGKTVVTLAILRALVNRGIRVSSAKVGPDYIDPKFHDAATGGSSLNLDMWGMRKNLIRTLLANAGRDTDLVLIEGVMGLFDGASGGDGSTADLAAMLNLPVVLVIDVSSQAQSVAAIVKGFSTYRRDCRVAGIILNRVGSPRHKDMLMAALEPLGIPVVGAVSRHDALNFPSRHLGLVQAQEQGTLIPQIDAAAKLMEREIDLDQLVAVGEPVPQTNRDIANPLAPLGQRIAIARDEAFSFIYPHLLEGWRGAGAAISFFSPLQNEAPDADSDAVYLPGGYPELHAARISGNQNFHAGLHCAAERGALIFGECGGYMVLGDYIVDADGARHDMMGLLSFGSNFANRKLHLGYRRVRHDSPLPWPKDLWAHEFHYASIDYERGAGHLFDGTDSMGNRIGPMGLQRSNVMGSYAHIIDFGDPAQ
ncbi:MAG: cobyrinate a,c-diamide synthase [Fimbriimonadaceae bacterium]|nr:cobyrinate a,c-diamide synthase [Alphaproteobacteria bacterium]